MLPSWFSDWTCWSVVWSSKGGYIPHSLFAQFCVVVVNIHTIKLIILTILSVQLCGTGTLPSTFLCSQLPLCPCKHEPCSLQPLNPTIPLLLWAWALQVPCINGITQYLSFCVRISSYSTMSLRLTCTVAWVGIYFILKTEYYSAVEKGGLCLCHCPPVDTWLFPFGLFCLMLL